MLTVEMAKELLRYDPETGLLYWRISLSNKGPAGSLAGCITPSGYIRIGINNKEYMAHRLVWLIHYGEFPKAELDHINHLGLDNRIENLRNVSHKENGKNQKKRQNNKSGVMGVSWDKRAGKWAANIYDKKKHIYLGIYADWFDAVCARKSAQVKYNFHPNHGLN